MNTVDIWQPFQNFGITNLEWVIGILLAVLLALIPVRNKLTILRKIWYPISGKKFNLSIDAKMTYPEYYEDIMAIQDSIVAEFAERGIKISHFDLGANYLYLWINNSQAEYYIELTPEVEEGEENGTQVLIKLQSTLPFRYRSDDNEVYITVLEQLHEIIETTIGKSSFTNYHLQAMLSDSGITGNTVKKIKEPKTDSLLIVRVNGLEGDSPNASNLFRLCKKYLSYAPPA